MRKNNLLASYLLIASITLCQAQETWKIAGDKITTEWSSKIDPNLPHPEYPRPILKREGNWKNLNGMWKYAITAKENTAIPEAWDGKILVPYAIESALSGVGKTLTAEQALWYNNQIEIPKNLSSRINYV